MPEQERTLTGRAIAAVVVVYGSAYPLGGIAEPMTSSSYNFYGVPGLLDMPTAESAADAELSGSFSQVGDQRRTTLTFQFTPRLSGSFRYSQIPGFDVGNARTRTDDRFDRNFDLRFQFIDENKWLPAVAVGIQDFIGTGIFSSEYIVATKTFFDDVRITAGLGWGRLGTRNPINSGSERDTEYSYEGGDFNIDRWFTGPMAGFGGISWTPTEKLTFKAEYSSDAYVEETSRGLVEYDSPWNFGAEYRFNEGVSVTAASMYGQDVGFQVNFTLNPKRPLLGPGNEPGPLPVRPRPSRSSDPEAWSESWTSDAADLRGIERAIREALSKEGIRLDAISLAGKRAEVRIENNRYWAESQAIGRTARVLTRALPPSVSTFTITPVLDGVPSSRVSMTRSDVERLENAPSQEILERTVFSESGGGLPDGMHIAEPGYPRTNWFLATYLGFGFFDPEEPVRADFGIRTGGSYTFMPGLVASGSLKFRIAGNTDFGRRGENDSDVPIIRTDFREYQQASDVWIDTLTLAHFGRPAPELYSRVTAGALERMFSGVSGELLWKPVDSRLALGAELNYVQKRDYGGAFGLLDYNVVSGHASAYYDMSNGYFAQLDAGRYLAGDYGATVTLDRRFDNGWRVGAFATFTDIPYDEFGEGSFDKGIFLELPLRWASGQPSKSVSRTFVRSLTKDGGQRVRVDDRLFERIRGQHEPTIRGSGGRFWR